MHRTLLASALATSKGSKVRKLHDVARSTRQGVARLSSPAIGRYSALAGSGIVLAVSATQQAAIYPSNAAAQAAFTVEQSAGFDPEAVSDFQFSKAATIAAARSDAISGMNWGPLWGSKQEVPAPMKRDWEELRIQLQDDENDWSFWIEWYESILNGTPLPWELTQRIALEIAEEEWEAGQAVVGPRIAEIRAAFDAQALANEVAESAYLTQLGCPGIGHNRPPSLIDDDLSEQPPETLIWVAASSLREEAASTNPDTATVRKAVGILVAALQASGLWVAQKLDKAITDAAGAFGKTFGGAAGVSLLAYVTGNSDKIMQLVDKVLSWLSLVG